MCEIGRIEQLLIQDTYVWIWYSKLFITNVRLVIYSIRYTCRDLDRHIFYYLPLRRHMGTVTRKKSYEAPTPRPWSRRWSRTRRQQQVLSWHFSFSSFRSLLTISFISVCAFDWSNDSLALFCSLANIYLYWLNRVDHHVEVQTFFPSFVFLINKFLSFMVSHPFLPFWLEKSYFIWREECDKSQQCSKKGGGGGDFNLVCREFWKKGRVKYDSSK